MAVGREYPGVDLDAREASQSNASLSSVCEGADIASVNSVVEQEASQSNASQLPLAGLSSENHRGVITDVVRVALSSCDLSSSVMPQTLTEGHVPDVQNSLPVMEVAGQSNSQGAANGHQGLRRSSRRLSNTHACASVVPPELLPVVRGRSRSIRPSSPERRRRAEQARLKRAAQKQARLERWEALRRWKAARSSPSVEPLGSGASS